MTIPTHADTGRPARWRLGSRALATAVTAAVLCAAAAAAPDRAGAQARARRDDGEDRRPTCRCSGDDRAQTLQMVHAIRFVLAAGGLQGRQVPRPLRVARRRDRLRAASGTRDAARRNARSYAADPTIVGVIGTYNSGCAAIEIPILNRVALAMVSPGNTYAGLTKAAIGNDFGEPASYYPAGGRNYTRVVPSDDNEGRIGAAYMKRTLHATKVFVLNDRSDYGRLTASTFEDEAKQLGLRIVGPRRLGPAAQELRRPDDADQGDRRRRHLHRRRHGPQRRAAPARQGGRARRQRQGEGRRDRRLRLPRRCFRQAGRVDRRRDRRHVARARRPTGSAERPAASCDAFAKAEGDVPIHDWTIFAAGGDAGPARRDRALRRHPQGRRREAVRDRPGEDRARADVVRRQRRPEVGDRGAVQGAGTATGSTSARGPTSRRSSRASSPGRRRRSSRSGRRSPRTTSTTRRTCRKADRFTGDEHPADAALRRGVQAQRVHRLAEDGRRRVLEPAATGRGSPTTTTSTRRSASGWATCRTGCTSRPRRAAASRRCSTTGPTYPERLHGRRGPDADATR